MNKHRVYLLNVGSVFIGLTVHCPFLVFGKFTLYSGSPTDFHCNKMQPGAVCK